MNLFDGEDFQRQGNISILAIDGGFSKLPTSKGPRKTCDLLLNIPVVSSCLKRENLPLPVRLRDDGRSITIFFSLVRFS
jgi:hypothetical protein